jgi:hypothetical protein
MSVRFLTVPFSGAPITDPTQAGFVPQWVKVGVAIPHTSFQTAGLTLSITLFSLVAGGVIHAVKIKHSVAFAGPAIATYTISVGIAGTLAKYASAFDVFQAVSNIAFQTSSVLGSESNGAAINILATAVSTGANLSVSTAGSVDIWALISKALP